VLGFDPLYQFMHEDDAADSICVALEKQLRGVYNVAGPQPMPLSNLIRAAGRTPVPVPEIALKLAFGRFGLPALPPGAVAHLKYPVVIDDSSFRTATGFNHKYDEDQTIAAFRSVAG
jgi:UDP-glucose 4-epimerase